jgi:hypothetical protein
MAAKSQTLANAFLSAVLRNVAYSSPATVYAALFTVAPTATTGGTEVVDANYARLAATFSAPVAGATSNSGTLTFFGAGAAAGPYTIVAVAIMDDLTLGGTAHVLYFGNLAVSKVVSTGDTLQFAATALSVTEQ